MSPHSNDSVEPRNRHAPEALAEGEEPPPPGVTIMAAVRWALLAFAAALAIFAWWSYARAGQGGATTDAHVAAKYHCPMHPQIVSNEPGECPVCHMQLEPISAGRSAVAPTQSAPTGVSSSPTMGSNAAKPSSQASGKASNTSAGTPAASARAAMTAAGSAPPGAAPIKLTLDRIQSIGVRTAVAGEGNLAPVLRVTAVVAPPEQGAAEVHVRSPGFVEQIFVNQTGIAVRRDQPLFALYSPEILQAQSELLVTQQWAGGAATQTAESARRKLELLGMSAKDIDQVARTRETLRAIPVYAAYAGYVTQKNLVAGSYVTPEMVLYTIQDLSHVYVLADIFQGDIGVVRVGTPGRFIPTRRPDLAVEALVDLIYPTLNAEARTTRVRMQVKNAKGRTFRPGEYGSVEFETRARTAVTVPRDAIIDTGLHVYVFVVEREGVFSPREVIIGEEQGELITVAEGISKGERVVSGATFLIDSESRLQAAAMQSAPTARSEPQKPSPQEGPSCDEFDRTKYPDKWTDCQKCAQMHRGMGSMEVDCKNAIPKPWR
jgi:Cu(I)/Ag(I) efflux system membrane fusion protein